MENKSEVSGLRRPPRPKLSTVLFRAFAGGGSIQLLGMGFSFVLSIQLARGLGASGFGIYGIAIAILALLAIPVEFGLPQLLTREAASAHSRQDWASVRRIVRWSTRVSLMFSLIALVAVCVWLLLRDGSLSSSFGVTLILGSVLVMLVGQANLRAATLRGLQFIVQAQALDVLARPIVFSLLLFVVALRFGSFSPMEAMGCGAVAALVSVVISATLLHRRIPALHDSTLIPVQTKAWISDALPMALSQGMHVILGNVMFLLLGAFAEPAAVANFRIATTLMLLVATPMSLLTVISGPLIARLHAQGKLNAIRHLLALVAVAMATSSIVLSIPFFTFGELLVSYVYGIDYSNSVLPLRILCVSVIISGALGANIALLNMCGHQVRVTRAFFMISVPMIFISIPLVYFLHLTGAAIGAACSTVAWNAILYFDSRRLMGVDPSIFSGLRNPAIFGEDHND